MFREVEAPAGVGDSGIGEHGEARGGGGRRWGGGAPGGADGAEAEDVGRGGEVLGNKVEELGGERRPIRHWRLKLRKFEISLDLDLD